MESHRSETMTDHTKYGSKESIYGHASSDVTSRDDFHGRQVFPLNQFFKFIKIIMAGQPTPHPKDKGLLRETRGPMVNMAFRG